MHIQETFKLTVMPSLFLLVLASFLASCVASSASGSGSGCSSLSDEEMKGLRLDDLFNNIAAQLPDLLEEERDEDYEDYEDYEDDLSQEKAVLERYHILQNTTENRNREVHRSCKDGDFFAKPVKIFSGEMSPGGPVTDNFNAPNHNVLAGYTIEFGFKLAPNLHTISRADLLLFQEPTITNSSVRPRDYVQFVDIATVFGGERHFIESKYLDTFGDGYKSFEVTNAVKLWLDYNVEGNVTIEVVVSCNSSPDCSHVLSDGTSPAKISFLHGHDNSKAPRIVVVSENPLEHADERLKKRNSEEDSYCQDDSVICCLKPLRIYFHEDLHMYNVLQPVYFEANYCHGICPAAAATIDDTNEVTDKYTFIRSLGNNHPAASIKPCCAGAQYRNLDVVMRVPDRATRRNIAVLIGLNQVIVSACRCG